MSLDFSLTELSTEGTEEKQTPGKLGTVRTGTATTDELSVQQTLFILSLDQENKGIHDIKATATSSPSTSRFPSLSTSDIEELKEENVKINTIRSTKTWMNVWSKWCLALGISQPIELFPYHELDNLLSKFYAEVKTVKGTDYEPECLRVIQAAIDRYLKNKHYGESIISSRHFYQSTKTLDAKAASLRRQGLGKRPNKAEALTRQEEEMLWENGSLGDHSPVALTNANFKCLSEQMGLRGRQDHYDAYVEDFVIRKHEDGSESVKFSENPTKTRSGGLRVAKRSTSQIMWSTDGGPRDPVRLFKLWLSKRPAPMRNQGPLYLSIIHRPKTLDQWYMKIRMGENTIAKIMKKMASSLQCSTTKKLTNHSTRKTVVQKLKAAGQPRHKIKEIAGHASDMSLDDYDVIGEEEHKQLSHIISGYNYKPSETTASAASSSSFSSHIVDAYQSGATSNTSQQNQHMATLTGINNNTRVLSTVSVNDVASSITAPSEIPVTSSHKPVAINNYNNCVFNITNYNTNSVQSPTKKRRRVIFDSDSD